MESVLGKVREITRFQFDKNSSKLSLLIIERINLCVKNNKSKLTLLTSIQTPKPREIIFSCMEMEVSVAYHASTLE